ncbi:hypothetical protein ACLOJK_033325 [Asimina triloba]
MERSGGLYSGPGRRIRLKKGNLNGLLLSDNKTQWQQSISKETGKGKKNQTHSVAGQPQPKNIRVSAPPSQMPISAKTTPKSLKKPSKWANLWLFKDKKDLKHVVFKMQLDSKTLTADRLEQQEGDLNHRHRPSLGPTGIPSVDPTALLSDSLLLQILFLLPISQHKSASIVCKRWLSLTGRLRTSLTLLDFPFLLSGRLFARFPNLAHVDLVPASIQIPHNSSIILSSSLLSVRLDSDFSSGSFVCDELLLPADFIDNGLRILARGCPNLRKLVLVAATEEGLSSVAAHCPTLQELELHRCTDLSLRAIAACENLQILRLIGSVDGFYEAVVSDIGLTILAHGCRRLVKLELNGCEGSYDGISAIGQCCPMLEELTLCDHRMDGGWIAALSFCGNLKTLRLQRCKRIDSNPGPVEHLGLCETLERLQLQQCQVGDKQSMVALFAVCAAVKEIEFQDCWRLDNQWNAAWKLSYLIDEAYTVIVGHGIWAVLICKSEALLSVLVVVSAGVENSSSDPQWNRPVFDGFLFLHRGVRLLSLEGCSLLTTEGLASVLLSWKELQRLRVVSCNNIKDTEVSPALASLFSALKELRWRPDSRSFLTMNLAGTGMGSKGGRFFKKAIRERLIA